MAREEKIKVKLTRREAECVVWMLESPDGRRARGINLVRTSRPGGRGRGQNYLEGTAEQLVKLHSLAETAAKMGWSENLPYKLGKVVGKPFKKRRTRFKWRRGVEGYLYYENRFGHTGVGAVCPAQGGGWAATTWLGHATCKTLKEAKKWVEENV